MKKSWLPFILLLLAFLISAAYQYYRSTVDEIEVYDEFGSAEMIRFTILIGISLVTLIPTLWARWIGVAYCLFCILIVLIKYYPNVYILRENGWIDILEPIVYLLLIFSASIFLLPVKRKKVRKNIYN